MRTSTRCRRAFTLVEMLIVIVVIGILAGIYLLAAEPSIERARATDCLSDRTTIKHQYYIMRSENGYNSEDFAEAVKKDLGRSNVEGDGSTFSNICRDGGVYTCSMDEYGRFSVVCSVHNAGASGTYNVDDIITTLAKNRVDISKIVPKNGTVDSELDSTSQRSSDAARITQINEILKKAGLSLDGYDWKIAPKSSGSNYYVYLTQENIANAANNSTISVTQYTINMYSGEFTSVTGTTTVVWDSNYKAWKIQTPIKTN